MGIETATLHYRHAQPNNLDIGCLGGCHNAFDTLSIHLFPFWALEFQVASGARLGIGEIPRVVRPQEHHQQPDFLIFPQGFFYSSRPVEETGVGQAGALAAEVERIDAVLAAQPSLHVRRHTFHHRIAGKKYFVASRKLHALWQRFGRSVLRHNRCGSRFSFGFRRHGRFSRQYDYTR